MENPLTDRSAEQKHLRNAVLLVGLTPPNTQFTCCLVTTNYLELTRKAGVKGAA